MPALRFAVQRIANADFFDFLGHIHGHSGASTNALARHMMLCHPQVNPHCLPGAVHESGSSLSAEAVLANCRVRQSSHAVLLGCGGGIPQHSAVDEPLGLVVGLLMLWRIEHGVCIIGYLNGRCLLVDALLSGSMGT